MGTFKMLEVWNIRNVAFVKLKSGRTMVELGNELRGVAESKTIQKRKVPYLNRLDLEEKPIHQLKIYDFSSCFFLEENGGTYLRSTLMIIPFVMMLRTKVPSNLPSC